MVLLLNLLTLHKHGGGGDEVLGFLFHKMIYLKFSQKQLKILKFHVYFSIYLFHVRNVWLKTTTSPALLPSPKIAIFYQACLKKMSNEAEGETKEARSPWGRPWRHMEVSAGKNHRKCGDLPAMFDCKMGMGLWDYGFSAF